MEVSLQRTIRIFTDGSAIGNPGPGGWAALILDHSKRTVLRGAKAYTCIAEMELTAALEALRSLREPSKVALFSDSELLIKGMQHLAAKWAREGWRNRRGGKLHYRAIWTELLALNAVHSIEWYWIKGHNGHREQQEADHIAHEQANALRYHLKAA
jgi:ribonuclease HI